LKPGSIRAVTARRAGSEVTENAPKLERAHFARRDDADDAAFYAQERLVHHLDQPARDALTAYYQRVLPAGGQVLDLMSSWVSHLPEDHGCAGVTGLGMNEAELAANPQLTAYRLHNLNAEPVLPLADQSFDACLIALSVQYLTRPLEVFADISRVLRPGGICAVSFSNRCFPTKAVAIWSALDDPGHIGLVATYFRQTNGFDEPVYEDLSPDGGRSDPIYVVAARAL
jgi:SAM-dependent methyltransferase